MKKIAEFGSVNTDCISHSPGVLTTTLVAGPVPALLTAVTDTLYRVDEVSPEIVADLLLELTTLSSSPLVLATTV